MIGAPHTFQEKKDRKALQRDRHLVLYINHSSSSSLLMTILSDLHTASHVMCLVWLGFIPYCVAAYHLRLIIAFSLGHTTTFVWGGCMLFRTQDLVEDAHALVSSWRNGGYSDDLIASSISQKNKLTIMCNPSSILLQVSTVQKRRKPKRGGKK